MKRIGFITIACMLCFSSCNGQSGKEKKETADKNAPKTDIKVNKEYDKDGNLIRYDSTYSSYYSNILNDTILGDSIFNNFKIDVIALDNEKINYKITEDELIDEVVKISNLPRYIYRISGIQ